MSEDQQNSKNPRRSIIVAGPFPPPVTGFAFITEQMAAWVGARCALIPINLSPHRTRGGLLYYMQRLFLCLRGIMILIVSALRIPSFYIACDGRWGILYTIVMCGVARLLDMPIFIHHHSYLMIDRPHLLMAILLRVSGQKARHIFLSTEMGQKFNTQYKWDAPFVVISNSAFVDSCHDPVSSPHKNLTIGLLSNLCHEKGLYLFLDLLRQAKAQGLEVYGLLAGPAATAEDRAAIDAACIELQDRLVYRGALYGNAKKSFYKAIDLFVFPTLYANEAQPTVLFEAMAHGVPVIAYDRGCIKNQVGVGGLVIERDQDFTACALTWIKEILVSPDQLIAVKNNTQIAFHCDQTQAAYALDTLFGYQGFLL